MRRLILVPGLALMLACQPDISAPDAALPLAAELTPEGAGTEGTFDVDLYPHLCQGPKIYDVVEGQTYVVGSTGYCLAITVTPAISKGSFVNQYCRWKGGGNALAAACADGRGRWVTIGRYKWATIQEWPWCGEYDACLNISPNRAPGTLSGFRFKFQGQGSGVTNYTFGGVTLQIESS